jgi:hypothetical protein
VFCLVFILTVLGVELKTLYLLGRYSTTWATSPAYLPPVLVALMIATYRVVRCVIWGADTPQHFEFWSSSGFRFPEEGFSLFNGIIQCVAFCDWLLSQSTMFSRSPMISTHQSFIPCLGIETGVATQLRLVWESLCSPGWPWTCDPPASTSHVLPLQASTMPNPVCFPVPFHVMGTARWVICALIIWWLFELFPSSGC